MAVVETTIGDTHFYLHYGRKGEVKPREKNLVGVSKMCRAMLLGKTGKIRLDFWLLSLPYAWKWRMGPSENEVSL